MVNEANKLLIYLISNKNQTLTIREISLNLGIPYMTLSRLMKKLSKQELVKIEKKGNNYLCRINLKYPLLKHHLIISSEEITQDYLNKQPIISIIRKTIVQYAPKATTALLFGSYAKNKQEKHSDIDLAFVTKNKKSLQKLKKELFHLEKLYDKEVNILIFTPSQFKGMLNATEENVGTQIFKNNIILYNPELFWEVALNGL